MDTRLIQKYDELANSVLKGLQAGILDDGGLGKNHDDLLQYYLAPYFLIRKGNYQQALAVLSYMENNYRTSDGVFKRFQSDDSSDNLRQQYPFIASWIAIAAHKLAKFDLSYPMARMLRNYYHPEQGAFTVIRPFGSGEHVLDVATTVMLGLMGLYFGDINKASRAGNFLQRCLSLQVNKEQVFYLRLNEEGKFITAFTDEQSHLYMVSKNQPSSQYILGLAGVFLAKLYQATEDKGFLRTAQVYQEVSRRLQTNVDACISWGAAVLANITKEQRYIDQACGLDNKVLENYKNLENLPAEGGLPSWRQQLSAISLLEINLEISLL